MTEKIRCPWTGINDPLYLRYHDYEWGVPVYDDRTLFEFLILEGAQAGLSWITVLRKRDAYRQAFDQFDPVKIANYGEDDIVRLMTNAGIVRNRRKIDAAIRNAQAWLRLLENGSTFADYLWGWVDGIPVQNTWQEFREVPIFTPTAERLSRDLVKRGFKFVGPTICYSYMQAIGMVNDHLTHCYRHAEIVDLVKARAKPLE